MKMLRKVVACVIALSVGAPLPTPAQQNTPAAPFKAEELDQLAAPIALYPDPLLAQVLMASTYPLEIVQAARFARGNAGLKGDQLDQALKQQSWDDSVKSLVSFPQVLAMMDAKLDWTQKLGDAFLAEQKGLMNAVQRLRARAQAEGNLKSTAEQTVTAEPAAAAPAPQQVIVQQAPPTIIKIEPANPQVIYIPTYNPTVVYGGWPYPAYPPYAYYPPGYVAGAAMFSFAAGVAVGSALWGNCNWRGGDVNVNVSHYNSYTRNVNQVNVAQKRTEVQANRQNWQHSPEHRKGTQYRDPATQQRFNRGTDPQAAQARESFRGRAEQGRQDLARGGAEQFRQGAPGGGAGQRAGQTGAGGRGGDLGARRGGARPETRAGGSSSFGQGRSGGGSAFEGMGQGRNVQQISNRGQTSRQSMGAERAGGFQGRAPAGGARGGGGGGRRR